ncbi:hypothetical protein D3C84_546310 [compost metagenome]
MERTSIHAQRLRHLVRRATASWQERDDGSPSVMRRTFAGGGKSIIQDAARIERHARVRGGQR